MLNLFWWHQGPLGRLLAFAWNSKCSLRQGVGKKWFQHLEHERQSCICRQGSFRLSIYLFIYINHPPLNIATKHRLKHILYTTVHGGAERMLSVYYSRSWRRTYFSGKAAKIFPLFTSFTLLFSLFYIVSSLSSDSSSYAFVFPLSICPFFGLFSGSRDEWDTVNPGCWLQVVKTPQLINVSGAAALNHAEAKAKELVSKPALSTVHQTLPLE